MTAFLQYITAYPFFTRALAAGALISLCASLLGVSLTLKRYSMIGDGLSHVGFGALALASVMHAAPLAVCIPVVVAAAFLLLRISENGGIKGDAAIALISTGALAVGVMIISVAGVNVDVGSYMFGSILSISKDDLLLCAVVSAVVLVTYILLYSRIFAVTFDESFAKASGIRVGAYNTLLALLTAITIVLGMRLMGALLISALVIFPALTSMRLFKSFRGVVISSAIISVICFAVGMMITLFYSTPAGASVVVVNIAAFAVFYVVGLFRR